MRQADGVARATPANRLDSSGLKNRVQHDQISITESPKNQEKQGFRDVDNLGNYLQPPETPLTAGEGWRVLSILLAGLLVYGGLGWVGDYFLQTTWLMPIGIVVGILASVYLVVKLQTEKEGNERVNDKS